MLRHSRSLAAESPEVGDNTFIRSLAGRGTRLDDLGGRTVVPGFIDAHSHPASAGLRYLRAVGFDLRYITAM
ncbi:MAG: amidohydrolase family protein [Gemmatimonadaceae bacterium]